jgi:hypothetical protein
MKYFLISLVLCGCSHSATTVPSTPSATASSTVNDHDARLRAACLTRLEQRLKEPRERLEKTKAAAMESKELKEACVRACEEDLVFHEQRMESIRNGGPLVWPPMNTHELAVGSIGPFPQLSFRPGANAKLIQVVDPDNAIIRLGGSDFSEKTNTWAKLSTAGLVDDQFVALEGVWEVTGTKTYRTALGSRTIFVVEQVAKSAGQYTHPNGPARIAADEMSHEYYANRPRELSDNEKAVAKMMQEKHDKDFEALTGKSVKTFEAEIVAENEARERKERDEEKERAEEQELRQRKFREDLERRKTDSAAKVTAPAKSTRPPSVAEKAKAMLEKRAERAKAAKSKP